MAKLYGEIAAKALLTLDKSFARANGQPLDASEVYYSLQAAKDYAATAQAYIGQKIVVVEDNVVTHYSVEDTAGNLKELGSKPVGDEKSITVAEDGTVSLAGIGTLVFEREEDVLGEDGQPTGEKKTVEVKYQPLMTKAGLVWVEPSKTTVEGLATLIDELTQRVSALETKVGNAAKEAVGEEGAENYQPAVPATGLHKTVEELDGRLDILENKTYSVKEGEKVLSLEGTEFSTTLKLVYTDNKIKLLGINDEEVSSFDASAFVADGVLENAEYDADTKELVFTWNIVTGEDEEGNPVYKTDKVNISDLVDTYTAGNGLNLNKENNQFSVKVFETDKYLTVDETGVHTKGIDEAIAAAIENLPTEDTNTTYTLGGNGVTVTLTPSEGAAQEFKLNAYTKSETDNKIDEKIASVTGGESAADVKLALESYRDAINTELWGEEAKDWTVTTEEDGKTKVTYTPQYGNTSRVDTLETKVKALEDVGAQANVIEAVVAKAGAKLAATTDGKTVTIDDTALVSLIGTAQNKADSNASEIEALKGRTTTVENKANDNNAAITALTGRVAANESAIETINKTSLPAKADKSVVEGLSTSLGTLEGTVGGHTTKLASIEETLGNKADASGVYSKTEIDAKTGTIPEGSSIMAEINKKANSSEVYTKTEIDAKIGTIPENSSIMAEINKKANSATTLAGYGITDAYTKGETDSAIASAVANASHLKREVVSTLPEENIDLNTIYMVAKSSSVLQNAYDEYMYINGKWEKIGDTAVDLTGYIKDTDTSWTSLVDKVEDIESGAQVNKIESIEVNGVAATLTNKKAEISIPAATTEALGLVKVDNNTIVVEEGVISVKEISTDLLTQGTKTLVLNGGSAKN